MNILIIDTSLNFCTAIVVAGQGAKTISEPTQRGHAELILGMIEELLARQHLKLSDLDGLAYVAGPARFTGVRIASSVCQALSFAKALPVVQIPSLQLIAQSVIEKMDDAPIVIAMDAFMNEIYWGVYQRQRDIMQPVTADNLLTPETAILPAGSSIGCGDAWDKYPSLVKPAVIYPLEINANALISLAVYLCQSNNYLKPEAVLPIYLRGKEAWKNNDKHTS